MNICIKLYKEDNRQIQLRLFRHLTSFRDIKIKHINSLGNIIFNH